MLAQVMVMEKVETKSHNEKSSTTIQSEVSVLDGTHSNLHSWKTMENVLLKSNYEKEA